VTGEATEKKAKKKQPTARTLDECRRRGWAAGVVERWQPGFRKKLGSEQFEQIPYGTRIDFLGFADIMVLDGQLGYLAIQACASGSVAARLAKAMAEPNLMLHLDAGNRFQVWGWREVWVDTSMKTKRRLWAARKVAVVLRGGMLFHEEIATGRGVRDDES
jgi:hypothetical protein